MSPRGRLDREVLRVMTQLQPALDPRILDGDGNVDLEAAATATRRVDQVEKQRISPTSAVYIAWDLRGRCRYVGSTRRPGARSAVTQRLREHMRIDERRARWAYLSVIQLRASLTQEQVRECEGRAAHDLCPLDGGAHPVPLIDRPLIELLAA